MFGVAETTEQKEKLSRIFNDYCSNYKEKDVVIIELILEILKLQERVDKLEADIKHKANKEVIYK